MQYDVCEWDEEGDPNGNVQHVAAHDVSMEEFQEVLDSVPRRSVGPSHSNPAHMTVVGETGTGRELRIVFVLDEDGGFIHVRPVTAYDPSEPGD